MEICMDRIAEVLGIEPVDINFDDMDYIPMHQSDIMFGDDNPMKDPKVKEVHLEVVRSEEYRQRMSEIKTGFKHSEETKKLMSESAKKAGTGKWMKGVPKTETQKDNMRTSALNRERVACGKCGNMFTKANIKKHENSCKSK